MKKFRNIIKRAAAFAAVSILTAGMNACAAGDGGTAASFDGHKTGSMELRYASQFHVDCYEDDVELVSVGDGLEYLLVPGASGDPMPEWISVDDAEGYTVIRTPVSGAYIAASSAMDLISAIGSLGSVSMTSTAASDWSLPEIRKQTFFRDIKRRHPSGVDKDVDVATLD